MSKHIRQKHFYRQNRFFANILFILWSCRSIHWSKWSSRQCDFTGYSIFKLFDFFHSTVPKNTSGRRIIDRTLVCTIAAAGPCTYVELGLFIAMRHFAWRYTSQILSGYFGGGFALIVVFTKDYWANLSETIGNVLEGFCNYSVINLIPFPYIWISATSISWKLESSSLP